MEQRANIKFCVKLGKTFTETLAMFRSLMRTKSVHQFMNGSWNFGAMENH